MVSGSVSCDGEVGGEKWENTRQITRDREKVERNNGRIIPPASHLPYTRKSRNTLGLKSDRIKILGYHVKTLFLINQMLIA